MHNEQCKNDDTECVLDTFQLGSFGCAGVFYIDLVEVKKLSKTPVFVAVANEEISLYQKDGSNDNVGITENEPDDSV